MGPGEIVAGRFRIDRQVGEGGMGVVYRAIDEASGEPVALKLMHRSSDETELERFAREARLLGDVSHPGVVRHVASGYTPEGLPYLAMEWVEGEDLGARLGRRPLDLAQSIELGRRVAAALGAAHARGIVHRDVKPENLVLPGGSIADVKVVDFGVARVQGLSSSATRSGLVVGTPGYMAPEQARAGKEVDARADVFALGCVLFECIAQRPAFDDDDFIAMLVQVVMDGAPRLRSVAPWVPEDVDEVIARLTAREPADRPRDGLAAALLLHRVRVAPGTPLPPRSRLAQRIAITTGEKRLLSIVLARPPDDQEAADPTLDSALPNLAGVAAHLEHLADGSVVGLLEGRGDAVVQASHAARLALSLRARLPGWKLSVAFERSEIDDRAVTGRLLDRLVPLLGRPGTIAVDELTGRLLENRFIITGDHGRRQIIGEREVRRRSRHALLRAAPFVGREREMAWLSSLFRDCVAFRQARVAVLVGPAGVGKSRLRTETLRSIAGKAELLAGSGDSLFAGAPRVVVAEAIRRMADLREGEPAGATRDKLAARVERVVPAEDVSRVFEFLAEIVGLTTDDSESVQLRAARADPRLMADQTRRAFEDLVSYECMVQPVVLTLEDLQWGDAASLQLVDGALRVCRDLPLLVLGLTRPEGLASLERLWGDRGFETLVVGPLGGKDAARLAREVLGNRAREDRVAAIVDRADGNPLFIEELARAESLGAGRAAETVLALMLARLEALPPEQRLVLRAGSLFGRVFSRNGVAALLGGSTDPDEELQKLVDGEVLSWRRGGRGTKDREYSFRQALAHEAAYAMLTPADRVVGHKLASLWLRENGEQDRRVLAEHFERGELLSFAAGYWLEAARQSLAGDDFAGALEAAGRGVLCGADGELLGSLRLAEAEAHRWRGENAETRACGLDALEILPRGSAGWCRAAEHLAEVVTKLGDTETLRLVARELARLRPDSSAVTAAARAAARAATSLLNAGDRETAEQLLFRLDGDWAEAIAGDPSAQAAERTARAALALLRGEVSAYLQATEAAYEAYCNAGDLRGSCLTATNVGYACQVLGAFDRAEDWLRDALDSARRMGLESLATAAAHNLGLTVALRGRLDEGRALETSVIEQARAQGDRRIEGLAYLYRARIDLLAGRLPQAERDARRAVELLALMLPDRVYALAVLAQTLVRAGRGPEAVAPSEAARRGLDEIGGLPESESLVRLARAEAFDGCGDHAAARAEIEAARARLEDRAAQIDDPALRQCFLSILENARTIELAGAWL